MARFTIFPCDTIVHEALKHATHNMSMVRWSTANKLSYQTTMGIIRGSIKGPFVGYRYTCRLINVLEGQGYVFAPRGFHIKGEYFEVKGADQEVTLASAHAQATTEQAAAN